MCMPVSVAFTTVLQTREILFQCTCEFQAASSAGSPASLSR